MLKSIGVRNFKSLKEADIEVKPLTILLGPNCSGKSSLTQALLLMRQTIEDKDEQASLVFRGPYKDLGSYTDLVYRHDTENNQLVLKLTLSTEIKLYDLSPIFRVGGGNIDSPIHRLVRARREGKQQIGMEVKFAYDGKTKKMFVSHLIYFNGENEIMFQAKRKKGGNGGDLYKMEVPLFSGEPDLKLSFDKCKLKNFFGFRKISAPRISNSLFKIIKRDKPFYLYRSKRETAKNYLDYVFSRAIYRIVNKVYEYFAEDICYLGPLRDRPRRFYIESGTVRCNVGFWGEWFPEILRAAMRAEKLNPDEQSKVYARTKYWLKEFDMASDIWPKDIEGYQFLLRLRDTYTGIQASIADQGFGVSQILPLIVEGLYAPSGTTLVVEQPEIHLHPKAQSTLADLLIEIMGRGVKLIVETHSDHIIEQIQSRIAEDKVDGKGDLREKIGMYLFFRDKKEKCSKVYRDDELQLDQYGSLIDWPDWFVEGFLDGPYLKAKRMLAARMKAVEEGKNE
ncbi:AAA family ATPase [candidate division WOR-3 bacterium]|nr:AAA family ATPase [candidate division WOR-3 bacterium]